MCAFFLNGVSLPLFLLAFVFSKNDIHNGKNHAKLVQSRLSECPQFRPNALVLDTR
jgi:hypothetical protein